MPEKTQLARQVTKEKLLEIVSKLSTLSPFGAKWQVSSNPEGCPNAYTKVYLRRKRVKSPWERGKLRVRNFMCECLSDEEAEKLKEEIRRQLEKLGLN